MRLVFFYLPKLSVKVRKRKWISDRSSEDTGNWSINWSGNTELLWPSNYIWLKLCEKRPRPPVSHCSGSRVSWASQQQDLEAYKDGGGGKGGDKYTKNIQNIQGQSDRTPERTPKAAHKWCEDKVTVVVWWKQNLDLYQVECFWQNLNILIP